MSECDGTRTALLLGDADTVRRTHLEGCSACRDQELELARLGRELAATAPAGPPPTLHERVLRAAAPLLRENGVARRRARAFAGLRLCAAPALALALLPLVLYVHVAIIARLYGVLANLLPRGLDLYLTATYAIFLAGLLALTYGALPLIVAHQRDSQGVRAHV